jgi:imidazolonepropionase
MVIGSSIDRPICAYIIARAICGAEAFFGFYIWRKGIGKHKTDEIICLDQSLGVETEFALSKNRVKAPGYTWWRPITRVELGAGRAVRGNRKQLGALQRRLPGTRVVRRRSPKDATKTRGRPAMLLRNARIATMEPGARYGLIDAGALVVRDGRIVWVGPQAELPAEWADTPAEDLDGRLVTPGLIDCHSHIVHGGDRAGEFESRLEGAGYQEIARAGGGIVSTVRATREANENDLLAGALRFADALIAEGASTIEVKSGYGLDVETELRMLRAARAIEAARPVRVRTTFLGAHAVPPDYQDRPDQYIDEVCLPALDAAAAHGLADAVDGFCEGIAFDSDQIARVFDRAAAHGLPVKLHAEQLSHTGGTALAARHGALSADHVEYATAADARALAHAGSVAVVLPGAFYTLHETQVPPIAAFREAGVKMALATDCNPGSSPLASLLLTLNMGCTLFRLTPEEALAGVTLNAARALGLTDTGVIAPGMRADLAVWDVTRPAELAYRIGYNPLYRRVFGGQV